MLKWKNCRMLFVLFVAVLLFAGGCDVNVPNQGQQQTGMGQESQKQQEQPVSNSPDETPADSGEYTGKAYEVLNHNIPQFTKKQEKSVKAFEKYEELDSLGRSGVAFANICQEIMPVKKRSNITKVKPSGWHSTKYNNVDGKYLYNRCHLIGFQLAGENANEKNLITGTRYLNIEGMLPFENEVAEYVKETDNHVLYRVTPKYEGDDLLAQGVQMEAYSVEDQGKGVCFNIFAYNVQPGIEIDYGTGNSKEMMESDSQNQEPSQEKGSSKNDSKHASEKQEYIINTNTKKFHIPSCSGAKDTLPKNRKEVTESRERLIDQGYEPCGKCNP